jgi:hypothetical protein
MDQLTEPIEVNRKFIKLLEQTIKPAYDNILQELVEQLQKDIDDTIDDPS